MRPWGGKGRAEAAEKAEEKARDPLKSAERVPWEPWGGMGPWSHGP